MNNKLTRDDILDKVLELNDEAEKLQEEINNLCDKAEAIVDIEDDEDKYSCIRCIRSYKTN